VSFKSRCFKNLSNVIKSTCISDIKTRAGELLYRTVDTGFYAGNSKEQVYYPYPSMKGLGDINYEFLRAI
jgi:hypothetical protein